MDCGYHDEADEHLPECTLISFRRAKARSEILPWCVRYAREADPLAKAWGACIVPADMRYFLLVVGLCKIGELPFERCGRAHYVTDRLGRAVERCAECADRIRDVFPTVTLAMVMSVRS